MKKLLTTFLILAFVSFPTTLSFAQTSDFELELNQDIETNIPDPQEQEKGEGEEEMEEQEDQEEKETLADTLQQEEVEQIQPQGYSFWTILGAILIPSTFLILGYFILKLFQ
jgi:hypothetical protein